MRVRVPAEDEAPTARDESAHSLKRHAHAALTRRGEAEAVTRWLVHDCGVGVPSVLISITGGAQDRMLPPNSPQP